MWQHNKWEICPRKKGFVAFSWHHSKKIIFFSLLKVLCWWYWNPNKIWPTHQKPPKMVLNQRKTSRCIYILILGSKLIPSGPHWQSRQKKRTFGGRIKMAWYCTNLLAGYLIFYQLKTTIWYFDLEYTTYIVKT